MGEPIAVNFYTQCLRGGHRPWNSPDAKERLKQERLMLAMGWRELFTTSKATQDRAEALVAKSKKEADEVRAAHDVTLDEARAATKRCHEAEASLKAL